MAVQPEALLQHLRRVASGRSPDPGSDATLIARFVERRDEAAFAALVGRHSPMVLGVCRRVLHDAHEAEDVAQATFLVLARKAATIRHPEALTAWLHGTARRLALRHERGQQRRRRRETASARAALGSRPTHPLDELSARELLRILDTEVERLPESYRLPVLLCCLEGRSQEEAARQLGWTPGSVKGRLERGRARLHARLAGRGLLLSAVLGAVEVSRAASPSLGRALVEAAVCFADRRPVPPGASEPARRLAEQALRGAILTNLKLLAVLTLGAGVALAAAGMVTSPDAAPPPGAEASKSPQESAAARTDRFGDRLPPGAVARLGTVRFRTGGLLYSCALAPDGKTVATGSADHTVRLFDAATGEPLRRLGGVGQFHITCLAYAPDGRALASGGYDNSIVIWDPATGRALHQFRIANGAIWDLVTQKPVYQLGGTPGQVGPLSCLAFTRDGKGLIIAGGAGPVRLLDVTTGKPLREFTGHKFGVRSMTLSPDGRRLASVSQDTTVLVWDVTHLAVTQPRPAPRTPQELEALWWDLADADAAKAYRAILTLEALPDQSGPLLAERLHPAADPDAERVTPLVARLESPRFAERERATEELAKLGWSAELALCKMLQNRPSLEARRRARELLDGLRKRDLPPELLRRLRAVEVLEHLETAEAGRALEALAKGVPGTQLTEEARAAQRRRASGR
jgi:RNA polymerase sigma factor (sigma-70 family)